MRVPNFHCLSHTIIAQLSIVKSTDIQLKAAQTVLLPPCLVKAQPEFFNKLNTCSHSMYQPKQICENFMLFLLFSLLSQC